MKKLALTTIAATLIAVGMPHQAAAQYSYNSPYASTYSTTSDSSYSTYSTTSDSSYSKYSTTSDSSYSKYDTSSYSTSSYNKYTSDGSDTSYSKYNTYCKYPGAADNTEYTNEYEHCLNNDEPPVSSS